MMTACLAAAAWIAVAVTQSPLVPLSLLVLSLSLCGGMLAVQAPRRSTFTRRHVVAGLLTVAALAVTSPALARRMAWRQL